VARERGPGTNQAPNPRKAASPCAQSQSRPTRPWSRSSRSGWSISWWRCRCCPTRASSSTPRSPGDAETHVNHRKPETWVVSFRGGPNGPDAGHYRNPIAAEAIINRHHNAGKNN